MVGGVPSRVVKVALNNAAKRPPDQIAWAAVGDGPRAFTSSPSTTTT